MIAVDSAVAHLAGGLGVPVWIMLPHIGCDWRWQQREDSPWYPLARLYRQLPEAEGWEAVVSRMVVDLNGQLA